MDSQNKIKEEFEQHNVSENLPRTSVFNNLSNISIGLSFRKSIRRLSDYYSANNRIIAQKIEKGQKSLNMDLIDKSSVQSDDSEYKL